MKHVAFNRPQSLERLRNETFDLVVIGGGITGAGVALDAASIADIYANDPHKRAVGT